MQRRVPVAGRIAGVRARPSRRSPGRRKRATSLRANAVGRRAVRRGLNGVASPFRNWNSTASESAATAKAYR